MREVKIGLIGLGTVGSGVYEVIEKECANILHKENLTLSIKKILALDYGIDIPDSKKAKNIEELVSDDEIEIIVELIGGIEPAKTFILAALNAGKSIVTANKELIARHWPDIEACARKNNVGFYFEASVGGGIPLLRTILDSLNANSITEVMGIINGTTNYILSKMTEEGLSYEEVLGQAQALGYAEANPKSDVLGYDAMYKLSILSSICFHAKVPVEFIYHEGIDKITQDDIKNAHELGYSIKLLAIGKKHENSIEARVHPTMIPLSHPLSSVRGSFNAVFLHGNNVDDVMLYGRGAGKLPTASAVVSDIILCAKTKNHKYMTFQNEYEISPAITFENDFLSAYYLRIEALDKPGVLSKISNVFAKYNVSISSVIQKGRNLKSVPLIFVTHKASEISIKQALNELSYIPDVLGVRSAIRVENE